MARKKHRKSAFVPRLLVPAAAAVSVVPAVAVVMPVHERVQIRRVTGHALLALLGR